MKDKNTADERTLSRQHLFFYLEVYNDETDELLARLVDISADGMKLISRNKIKAKQNFRLRMKLPEIYYDQKTLIIEATSMWSKKDVNPEFHVVGMQVKNLSLDAFKVISDLISKAGFNEI